LKKSGITRKGEEEEKRMSRERQEETRGEERTKT